MINRHQQEVMSGTRFEFGKNWKDFLNTVSETEIQKAAADIKRWLQTESLKGKRIIDIGSGSGIHSYVFYLMNAEELISFDYDTDSVEATKKIWQNAGSPDNWKITQGSILDTEFANSLGKFDIIYSWGVLHHTGNMWKAIENASSLLNANGIFWISIYQKGPAYPRHLKLKLKYNASSPAGKKIMIYSSVCKIMIKRVLSGKNPFKWNQKTDRGMNVYHDLIDWLGGLPYEVADKNEIEKFCNERNLKLEKAEIVTEGGCSNYLFRRIP
jgi:2-polyprenyl-3-methyl-5-hydroxy-6-metoxy-1,4-benzoquinol methylase